MAETKEIKEKISPIELESEMQRSYVDYAMSVIVGRALPDARDGLKPVHRRILYAMQELGLDSHRTYKKSARIVGEVMGKYHPHGDSAIYDALCRMAQSFSLRYPLVDGQGNFGSIDGDSAAAMRYTEARLESIAAELLADIEKETVTWTANFDESLLEPSVLPSKLPNLLVNGSTGIAVGMATNIPPHNLREVVAALNLVIENPEATIEEIMAVLPGPDFPSGGYILGKKGIEEAYRTGHGLITIQARTEIEELGHHRESIIITELPYEINKSNLVSEIAQLSDSNLVDGIATVRDESDKEGIRVVIELKTGESPELVLNQLYKHSKLRTSYGIINLALVEGKPVVMPLPEMLSVFLAHRREIITRRTRYDLRKAEERLHILEGYLIALANIEAVVQLIKSSKSIPDARAGLQKKFKLSERQADAVLAMPLARLTGLEQDKIHQESDELKKNIAYYNEILANPELVNKIIRTELQELARKYGDKRRTEILPEAAEMNELDLIKPEDVVVTLSASGYIKRVPLDTYRRQRRGGRGMLASSSKEEDYLKYLVLSNTLDYLLFFTNLGRVHWLRAYQVPEQSRQAKGRPIINLLRLQENETVAALIPVNEFKTDQFLLMVTERGLVKKTSLASYSRPRNGGIIAMGLRPEDRLVGVRVTGGQYEIFLSTRRGMAIRFPETNTRAMGRTATGVIGVRLRDGDVVVGGEALGEAVPLLTVTEKGYGKRSLSSLYRLQKRGGKGIIDIHVLDRKDKVVAMRVVKDSDEILILTQKGQAIRIKGSEIRCIGRNTKGVKLINLLPGDRITDFVVSEIDRAEEEAREEGNA